MLCLASSLGAEVVVSAALQVSLWKPIVEQIHQGLKEENGLSLVGLGAMAEKQLT